VVERRKMKTQTITTEVVLRTVATIVVIAAIGSISSRLVESSCTPFGPNSVIYEKYSWFDHINTILSLPLVLDVDGDEQPEIFFLNARVDDPDCTLYFGTQVGTLQALKLATLPGGKKQLQSWWVTTKDYASETHPAIAKVPGTAPQQYIICGYASMTSFFCLDALTGFELFVQTLHSGVQLCTNYYGAYSAVALSKLESSSDKLYLLASSEVWEYDPVTKNVTFHCAVPYSGRLQMPYAADIDFDGVSELFFENCVYSFPNCSVRWCTSTLPFSSGITSAVANIDPTDPYPEVVMVGDGSVALYRKDGAFVWQKPISAITAGGPPAVGDFDGDGYLDIGINNQPLYAVFSGVDGTKIATYRVTENSHFTSSASFDFDLDGKAEMIHCGTKFCTIFSSNRWNVTFPKRSATGSENSIVVDVDNDGMVDWLAVGRGLSVLSTNDSWPNTISTWTTHGHNGYDLTPIGSFPQVVHASNMFRSNPATLVIHFLTTLIR